MLKKFLALSLLIISTTTMTAATAAIVTFEPPPLANGQAFVSSYTENGVSFTGNIAHTSTSVGPTLAGDYFASNSSTGFVQLYSSSTMTVAMTDSSLFSLGSVDLAEYSTVFASPQTITFTGYLSGGGTTSQTFITDGIIDGSAGLDDFESFVFNASFTGLTSLIADTVLFSMDNLEINSISVSAVPLPAAVWLFGSGLIGLVGARRKARLIA